MSYGGEHRTDRLGTPIVVERRFEIARIEFEPGGDAKRSALDKLEDLRAYSRLAGKPDVLESACEEMAALIELRNGKFKAREKLDLSPRQAEILSLMVGGQTNKEIARVLGLDFRTVSTHATRLYQKMGVVSRTEAAVAGWAIGIV